MLKKLLSYFYPVKVRQIPSTYSKSLDVQWQYGQLVLDTPNANYSFGSLHRVLRVGLQTIGQQKIAALRAVLVLGVGGGSIIHLLRNDFKCKGRVVGVEIDPAVIDLAQQYFSLSSFEHELVMTDAEQFITETRDKFDLIVVDLFYDSQMPAFLTDMNFWKKIALISEGFILFNTIVHDINRQAANNQVITYLQQEGFLVQVLSNLEGKNELIVACKP